MIASDARIAANRANALRSTGPRTAEGKERSRGNALKHGMTGAGIALPREDADRVERRLAGFEAHFRPATEAGLALARRAAMLSVRVERCAVQEAAALSTRVRHAEADFDDAREAEVDHLIATIGEVPATAVRRLLRMPEGVDRMLETWADLRADLAHGDGSRWVAEHTAMAVHLTGRKLGGLGFGRAEALARAVGGDFALLGDEDGAGLDARARREWARRGLLSLIDAAVGKLEAHRETLDHGAIAADRAGAADRALFDPSKEATLARKYEAAAEREMHRALKELRAVEAEAAEIAPMAAPLGSFSPGVAARPVAPAPVPSSAPSGSRFGSSEGSSFVPMTIGRAGSGSA